MATPRTSRAPSLQGPSLTQAIVKWYTRGKPVPLLSYPPPSFGSVRTNSAFFSKFTSIYGLPMAGCNPG
ncbi:hypothetical protein BJY04DRAFT_178955 [Aspergillus karnatakaensis]|uniref:uncharacterized protein n=1 Tax=Aspergillus karnatakaensis TaxID=1810916 RepID=UPI003CCDB9B9